MREVRAEVCRDLNATLVQFSNDCVFDGTKSTPPTEDDALGPISAYGISEVAGERFLRYMLPDDHSVRSVGLYGVAGASGKGGNFVETMLRFCREGRRSGWWTTRLRARLTRWTSPTCCLK